MHTGTHLSFLFLAFTLTIAAPASAQHRPVVRIGGEAQMVPPPAGPQAGLQLPPSGPEAAGKAKAASVGQAAPDAGQVLASLSQAQKRQAPVARKTGAMPAPVYPILDDHSEVFITTASRPTMALAGRLAALYLGRPALAGELTLCAPSEGFTLRVPAALAADAAQRGKAKARLLADPSAITVTPSVTEGPDRFYLPGQVLANCRPEMTLEAVQKQLASLGGTALEEHDQATLRVFVIQVPKGADPRDFAARLQKAGLAPEVVPNVQATLKNDQVPNDPSFGSQWFLRNGTTGRDISAVPAWALFDRSNSNTWVSVAVVDGSGFDMTHPDWGPGASILYNSYDAVNNDNNPQADSANEKHGTPCAGVIAAATNNSVGVASVGWTNTYVTPIRIGFNHTASGTYSTNSTIASRMASRIVATQRMVATSHSYSGSGTYYSSSVLTYYQNIHNNPRGGKGAVLCASSGNSNLTDAGNYPASYDFAVTVGATNTSDLRASFSNYGNYVEVSAPGTSIYTLDRQGADGYSAGDYTSIQGTSFSCPITAGVCAAIARQRSNMGRDSIAMILQTTCNKVGGYSYATAGTYGTKSYELGYGRVNMFSALALLNMPVLTSLSPTSGPIGTSVTITGSYLFSTAQVLFGTTAATITSVTSTQVVATVPNGLPLGANSVKVVNGAGESNTLTFTVSCPTLSAPAITAGGPTTFCAPGSVSLTTTYTLAANQAYYWSNGAATQSTAATATGSYTLRIRSTLSACTSAASNAIAVNATPRPAPPATASQVFCSGANPTVANLSATGTAIQWYAASTGGTALAGATALSTATYYASQTVSSCESATRSGSAVTVTATPGAPGAAASQAFCSAASPTVASLSSSGATVKWYSASSGGTALLPADALSTGTYYATQTVAGCESVARTAVSVTVTTSPAAPVAAASQRFCPTGSPTVASLAATGTSIRWYSASTGGTPLDPTAYLVSGTYYASQATGSCESPSRTAVAASLISTAAPAASAAGPTTFCQGGSVQLTTAHTLAAGESYHWSNGATTASITVTTAGSYTLRILTNAPACTTTASSPVVVSVDTLPAAPVIAVNGPTSVCPGDQTLLSGPAGFSAYQWSTGAATSSIQVGAGSYTLRVRDGNLCLSPASDAVTIATSATCITQWDGSQSGTWADPQNWTPAGVPLATDSVTIAPGPNQPSLPAGTTGARAINVLPGAALAIPAGATLSLSGNLWSQGQTTGQGTVLLSGSGIQKVSGTMTIGTLAKSNGQGAMILSDNSIAVTRALAARDGAFIDLQGNRLRLRSTADGTAYLETVAPGTLRNAQNLVTERYIAPQGFMASTGGWTFVGAQVQGQVLSAWSQPQNQYAIGTYDPANPGNISLFGYDPFSRTFLQNNGYVHAGAAPGASAPVGRGLRLWTRPSFYAAGGTFTQKGQPLLGSHAYSIVYCPAGCAWPEGGPDNGWNLIANPYAAPLDWDAATGWTRAGIAAAWWAYSGANRQFATYLPGVGGTFGATRLIAQGQGFFVQATGAGAQLAVAPAVVTSAVALGGNAPYVRSGSDEAAFRLQLSEAAGQGRDEVLLAFRPSASGGYSPAEDALKLFSGQPSLALQSGSRAFAIGSYPMPAGADTLPLQVQGAAGAALSLSVTEAQPGLKLFLLDRQTGAVQPLLPSRPLVVQTAPGAGRYALVALAPTGAAPSGPDGIVAVPNPASGAFRLLGLKAAARLTLTDALGRVVLQRTVQPGQAILTHSLPAGLYRWAIPGSQSGSLVVE